MPAQPSDLQDSGWFVEKLELEPLMSICQLG
jgi:hypothetical protein